jgi:hypothetical protein
VDQLHWDGSNPSLAERNLRRAGRGVTPGRSIMPRSSGSQRNRRSLPATQPHKVDTAAAARTRAL